MGKTKLSAWQLNPKNIKTDKVQFWQNGVMITAQMDKENAQAMVRNGRAFIITEQVINSMIDITK